MVITSAQCPTYSWMSWITSICPSRPTLHASPSYSVPGSWTLQIISMSFLALCPLVEFGHWGQHNRPEAGRERSEYLFCGPLAAWLLKVVSVPLRRATASVRLPSPESCSLQVPVTVPFICPFKAKGRSHFLLFLRGVLHGRLLVSFYRYSLLSSPHDLVWICLSCPAAPLNGTEAPV